MIHHIAQSAYMDTQLRYIDTIHRLMFVSNDYQFIDIYWLIDCFTFDLKLGVICI